MDNFLGLLNIPTSNHRGQGLAHLLHLRMVRSGIREEVLVDEVFDHPLTRDQACFIKWFGEGQERGARDDCLVEIEEGGALTHV